ncbi:MAG: AmmeMemoRadiSam system radical SAM enzyme [Candidatus Krumholzibacteria bacterium]|nr:AmmeMemoRadiSam system radical SAM enzyme [Candidatus Krumholzibacteria bacterium]
MATRVTDQPAAWWRPMTNGQVACDLCPIGCRLREGQTGPCATRANRQGVMEPLHYGRIVAAGVDPIEKKPLYHFHPGRSILSVAAPGCNLHCQFCQNWTISQNGEARTTEASPKELVRRALAEDSVGIAFTYSEPLVWFEFVRDTAQLARQYGLKNVLVTNGYLNPEPLAELLPWIDAANVDLKAMDPVFYRKVCKAQLPPVLAAIRQFHAAGVHLEVTNLIIPGHNDSDAQLEELIDFVADLSPQIPLHFSAYHPAWKMDAPATPRDTLLRAYELASQKLDWVYLGNVSAEVGRDSVCGSCGEVLVGRAGYRGMSRLAPSGQCPKCAAQQPFKL